MHLSLKEEASKPAGLNFLQQKAKFDNFIDIFSREPDCRISITLPRQGHRRHPWWPHLSGT
jgi:hypothetical protein